MDPPEDGYEKWRSQHTDCVLVHVMWTDYCGILHEKLIPAENFDTMYRNDTSRHGGSSDAIPLTVSGAALTSLPDGDPAAVTFLPPYETCNLIPDYNTIQPCIDSRARATVFARVESTTTWPILDLDPRLILKKVYEFYHMSKEGAGIKASLEFQFVLRKLSDGQIPQSDGPAQAIVLKLAQAIRAHSHTGTGISIRYSDISMDGLVTLALSMSDSIVEAVDDFYRVKRALKSIANLEGLRPSFFYPSEDKSAAPFSGTHLDVMCSNKLRCRLHLRFGSDWDVRDFAANLMESHFDITSNPSIYAFSKPNWLTYGQREQYRGDQSPKREWMTWGNRNCKTTINFPCERSSQRLEFGDIDCMANMYLVVASAVTVGGWRGDFSSCSSLWDIPQALDVDIYDLSARSKVSSERQRVPLTSDDALESVLLSARHQDTGIFEHMLDPYWVVRRTEDNSIVEAVEQGRATSARDSVAVHYTTYTGLYSVVGM